jgi:hypothetical protein
MNRILHPQVDDMELFASSTPKAYATGNIRSKSTYRHKFIRSCPLEIFFATFEMGWISTPCTQEATNAAESGGMNHRIGCGAQVMVGSTQSAEQPLGGVVRRESVAVAAKRHPGHLDSCVASIVGLAVTR